MAPFTASNVWRASVHVIALLMLGHSLLASPNEYNNDKEECMYECSASELQMFNCSENPGRPTSYTPSLIGSQSYCCPRYFKTASGKCQICNDAEFMPRLNNCSNCKECKDCDTVVNDAVKKLCTREENTVCWIETSPAPSPGLNCPVEGLSTTTGHQEIQTTTKYGNFTVENQWKIKAENFQTGVFVLLPFSILSVLFVSLLLCCCCCLYRLGEVPGKQSSALNANNPNEDQDQDQMEPLQRAGLTEANNRSRGQDETDSMETWKGALTPFAKKFRKSVQPCIGRCRPGCKNRENEREESDDPNAYALMVVKADGE